MSEKHGGHDDHKKDDGHGKDKSTTSGGEKVKGIIGKMIESMLEPLKGILPKKNLNVLISLLNPWLDESAEATANRMKKWTRDYPWLRNKAVGSALGAFAAQIEEEAEKYDEPTKVFFKKASDWFETFSSELLREDSGDAHKSEKKKDQTPLHPELQDALAKASADIVTDSAELIKATPPGGKEAMDEILAGRADSLWKVQDRLLNGPPKPEKPKEPHVPFSERLHQVGEVVQKTLKPLNEELERGVARLQAHNQKLRDEKLATASPRSNSPGAKLLRWLFK